MSTGASSLIFRTARNILARRMYLDFIFTAVPIPFCEGYDLKTYTSILLLKLTPCATHVAFWDADFKSA